MNFFMKFEIWIASNKEIMNAVIVLFIFHFEDHVLIFNGV